MSAVNSVILFDLGGVLADLGDPVDQMGLDISNEEFWSTWLGSVTVHAFETGRMSEDEFLATFPKELGLGDLRDDFHRRINRWRLELFPGVVEMIARLRGSATIALLSNTNSLHWRMIEGQAPMGDLFDEIFLSFEMGICKPADAVFELILDRLSATPDEIIFLDDSMPNVEAARRFGIRAIQADGSGGMDTLLSRIGI